MNSTLSRAHTLGSATFAADREEVPLAIDMETEVRLLRDQIQQLLLERDQLLKQQKAQQEIILKARPDFHDFHFETDEHKKGQDFLGYKHIKSILGAGKHLLKETPGLVLYLSFGIFSVITLGMVLSFAGKALRVPPNAMPNAPALPLDKNIAAELTKDWVPKDLLRKMLEEN